jgi:hypothetical protein
METCQVIGTVLTLAFLAALYAICFRVGTVAVAGRNRD